MNSFIVYSLIAVVVVLSFLRRRVPIPKEEGFGLSGKPTLWWFIDSEKGKEKNRGYLELVLNKLYKTQGASFIIKPLYGRRETLAVIDGGSKRALMLPPDLWRSYVIANLCAQKGGLVVDGNSTLFISNFPLLTGVDAAMFGTHPDEPIVSPMTAVAAGPAPYVGWSATKDHPAWIFAAHQYNALVEAGQQAWGAASARRMFLNVWQTQSQMGAGIIRGIDGSRRKDGTKLQLCDIFGKTRLDLPSAAYVTYDGDDLARRFEFNWFLRLSPKQILESSCAWCLLVR